jgi:hypothetical protein
LKQLPVVIPGLLDFRPQIELAGFDWKRLELQSPISVLGVILTHLENFWQMIMRLVNFNQIELLTNAIKWFEIERLKFKARKQNNFR